MVKLSALAPGLSATQFLEAFSQTAVNRPQQWCRAVVLERREPLFCKWQRSHHWGSKQNVWEEKVQQESTVLSSDYTTTQLGLKLAAHANTRGHTALWTFSFLTYMTIWNTFPYSSVPQQEWEMTQKVFSRRVSHSEWFLNIRFFFSFFQILELFNIILIAYTSRALFLKRSCMQEKHVHSMQHSSVVASSSKYRVQLSRKFLVQRNMHSTAIGSVHHQHNEVKELQSCSSQRRISFPDFS